VLYAHEPQDRLPIEKPRLLAMLGLLIMDAYMVVLQTSPANPVTA
jgi:hypothetical protein